MGEGRWLLVVATAPYWEVFERLAAVFFSKSIFDLLGTLVVRWLSPR